MGLVAEAVTGKKTIAWRNKTDQNRIYNEAFHEALYQLEPEDRERIMDMIKSIAAPVGPIRQFGTRAAMEAIGMLGIYLASLSEQDFQRLLVERRYRRVG